MVAIKNNKGISLVDLMIAIAVLALLLVPIILHTVTTINTSAKAKEKQYVIDSATAVMEYFNQSSLDDIKSNKNVTGLVNISTAPVYHRVGGTGAETPIRCYIFVNGSPTTDYVDYNATDFIIDDVQLGRAKNTYSRAVVMTDLANRLKSGETHSKKRYEIDYNVKSSNEGGTPAQANVYNLLNNKSTTIGDFEILSDHSAVIFDHPNQNDRHIVCVNCKEVTDSYVDPNAVSLGNIQDLDADKIAIIEGDETKLDHRFESDLVSKILDYASRNAGVISEDILTNTSNLNSTILGLIRNESNTFSRMLYVSVLRMVDATGKEYYNVKCDVTYYVSFSDTTFKIFNGSNSGKVTYNVMNRDFYTTEPPDVFMVYEPFITDSSGTNTNYAYKDYICIKSDPYTSGYEDGYDPSKIYLVKPDENFQKTKANWRPAGLSTTALLQSENMYYSKTSTGFAPVEININQIKGSVRYPDGTVISYNADECLPLQVVTNITSYKVGNDYYPKGLHSDSSDSNDIGILNSGQFSITSSVGSNPSIDAVEGNRVAYTENISSVLDSDGNPAESIVTPDKESNFDGKLYNITVMYRSPSGETTYLTGAKGAE